MTRPVTIITGQFGDVPSEELFPKMAAIGYDGLELACGSEHFDVKRCLHAPAYWPAKRAQLEKYGLKCWALSNHCVGQGVCDLIDQRNLDVIPEDLRDSDPERVWRLCAEEMKETARAASMIGAKVVTGFTGSSIWRYLYSFPPVPQVADDLTYEEAVSTALAEGRDPLKIDWIRAGFELFKERWNPILDAFDECGV
ncbi:MAG: TIM barrel protein, partial [Thermoguttaceae bacterium]|nr:TIM barrel protein [Thermoguttaceae bacterium]